MLIKIGADLFRVLELQHVTPGNLRGFVRAKFRNIRTGTLADQKLRSEDYVERAILDEREMQYLYRTATRSISWTRASYEQLHIDAEVLGETVNYMIPDALIKVEFYGSEPVGIELPPTVDLKVEDTAPGIKGATASTQVKPARSRPAWSSTCRRSSTPATRCASAPRPASICRGSERSKRSKFQRSNVSKACQSVKAEPRNLGTLELESLRRSLDGHHTASPERRVDRGHHRQHVQREERRAHPPAAARPDRASGRSRSSSRGSTTATATTTSSRTARCGSPRQNVASSRELLDAGAAETPKSSASTKGSSSTPSCRPCAARSPTRASA